MVLSVPKVTNIVTSSSQSIKTAERSWNDVFTRAAKKISTLVIPIIIAVALISIPKANAGPVTYNSCVQSCINMGYPPFLATCIAVCAATLGPWCP